MNNDRELLLALAVGFFLIMLFQHCVSSFRSWFIIKFNSFISIQMGANLFSHLIKLPMSFFYRRHIGDLVSRFGSVGAVKDFITTGIIEIFLDGLTAIAVFIMMFIFSPMLSFITVIILAISMILQLSFFFPIRRTTEENIHANAKEDSIFIESLRSIQTIKLFNFQPNQINKWLNRYAEVINTDIKLSKLGIVHSFFDDILFGLESILILFMGALAVMDNELTIGVLLAFIAYKISFLSSTISFIDGLFAFKMMGLHIERLSDIVLAEVDNITERDRNTLNISGHIKVEKLYYRYDEASHI